MFYGFPQPGQTGQMPVIPPAGPPQGPEGAPQAALPLGPGPFAPTGMPPGVMPPGAMPPGMPPGPVPPGMVPGMYPSFVPPPMELRPLEEPGFESLTRGETSHWRGDLKWTFGLLTALFIFLALASAGLYRATGPGAARQVMVPLIENATRVKEYVKENYQDLRTKARKSRTSEIYIPDIGASISIEGSVIVSLSAEDLAERVINELEKQLYSQGYRQSLPMRAAQGAGEERAQATAVTLLSKMNLKTHNALLWPIVIFGVLALALGILLFVFCRGWGKALGLGLALIFGALPGSLLLRAGQQFFWKPGVSGTFKPAANQALRTMSSLALAYFDIALALGALVLLVGVVGAVIARKAAERVPPFRELTEPETMVAGGPAVEPGMQAPAGPDTQGVPDDLDSFFLKED